jgi:tetratricopeptide (TPR) repeat protein
MQAYSAGRYAQAARFYGLISHDDDPRTTPKETWRYLGKALLADGKAEAALPPINHALDVEDNLFWKSDGLLDKSKALLALNRLDEAMTVAEECQAMKPEGRVGSEIRLAKGDIWMKRNDPAKAAAEYVNPASILLDDNDQVLKPLAMWKLEGALNAKGDKANAAEYKAKREKLYPTWKAPQG